MALWEYKWFYLGDCACLITGKQPGLIERLLKAVEDPNDPRDPKDLIKPQLDADSDLVEMIKDSANASRVKPGYRWTKSWPYKDLLICKEVPRGEIIMTPTQVILPFPFPLDEPNDRFRTEIVNKVLGTIPKLKDVELAIQPPLYVRATLDTVEELLKDTNNPKERDDLEHADNAGKRKAIMDYGTRKGIGPIDMPKPEDMIISASKDVLSTDTSFKAISEDMLHLDIGLDYQKTSNEGGGFTMDPWPCGAFE